MLSFTVFLTFHFLFFCSNLVYLFNNPLVVLWSTTLLDCRATVIDQYIYVVHRTTLNVVFRSSCDSMEVKITKYIPPERRLTIAQEVIQEEGIRPLARKLDVNPKSVYKYKNGNAHPGDEVMAKILSIAEEDTQVDLDNHFKDLREEFISSIEDSIDELTGSQQENGASTEPEQTQASEEASQENSVGSEPTDENDSESVDERSTKSLSFDDICEKIGVTGPFNRTKVEKLLDAMEEVQNPKIDELVEESNLSREAVENYLEKLRGKDIIELSNEETYKIKINISEGD